MPHFWEHISGGRPPPRQRKLQDGLFQIATQTCSLLVQVNNTNNITFGDNASNIMCNNIHGVNLEDLKDLNTTTTGSTGTPLTSLRLPSSGVVAKTLVGNGKQTLVSKHQDQEQLLVLIPPTNGKMRYKQGAGTVRKPRLSTVLEGPVLSADEESDLWNNGYVLPANHDGSPVRRYKGTWCRPSCIPITIILILIFLVVLLPLLDHATDRALHTINDDHNHNRLPLEVVDKCPNTCRIQLVESIPEGLNYSNNSIRNPSTYETWLNLLQNAQHSVDIASFYWSLKSTDIYPDPSSEQGQHIFDTILQVGLAGKVAIRIAQNAPSPAQPNEDSEDLVRKKAATVRSLNFKQLLGNGVLHTKFWIVDGRNFYLGSANMDWRSLTQVKELGIVGLNCSCLVEDLAKIFEVYWTLGAPGARIPNEWPQNYSTNINMDAPLNYSINNLTYNTYFSSSPPPLSPTGRSDDLSAILHVIQEAEKFIYISVMDYFPLTIYTPKVKYWPPIDDALRRAAIDSKIDVRLLISKWNHSRSYEEYFLKSLAEISDALPKIRLSVRRFIVPSTPEQARIPFARVNHNKYMVTDRSAYVGTSNWAGDYFIDTAGAALIASPQQVDIKKIASTSNEVDIRAQLQEVFERDWNSDYSHPLSENL